MHPRNGFFAHLPAALRQQVNLKLRDNVPGPKIAEWLEAEHPAALKEAGFGDNIVRNLNNWRQGGYAQWEKRQERLEEMRLRQEFAVEFARQHGDSQQANLIVVASQIDEVLEDFDIGELKGKLDEKPELLTALVEARAKINRDTRAEKKHQLDLTKYQDKVAEQKRKIELQLGVAKSGGLTPEVLAEIQEALNLL